MAAQVQPLAPLRQPSGPASTTAEQKYWQSFKSSSSIPSPANNPITHISSPPVPSSSSSEYFAVTSGPRVQIFSTRTRKPEKLINRFSAVAHGAEIRSDGRILVAGDDTGAIQVFDINSRAILKSWNTHKQPVWCTRFNPRDATQIMSASDDRSVRVWDLVSSDPLVTLTGHGDYVRCGAWLNGQASGLLVSGSYDQTVRIWDPRVGHEASNVLTFKHSEPVEAVLAMPAGTTIVSAAGNKVSVLDIIAGKTVTTVQSHQKAVTCLSLASRDTRVVSGGLDGHVKVYETSAWNVVYGTKYPSPVLSLCVVGSGLAREDRHLAVGMQSGMLAIRTRLAGQAKIREKEREQEMQALLDGRIVEHDKKKRKRDMTSGLQKRLRGTDHDGEGADVVLDLKKDAKRKKLKKWEKELRGGHYANALDLVLLLNDPVVSATAITALRHRSALRDALSGRDEEQLQPVLRWVHKYIIDPRYVKLCVEVGIIILDLYSAVVGQSVQVDSLVRKLHNQVQREVDRAQQAWQTEGMLQMLMAT